MRKSKDKLVVMVIYWQNHLVRPVPKKWIQVHLPLTAVLVSWSWQKHAAIDPARSCCPITCPVLRSSFIWLLFLFSFLPLPLYAHLMLSGSQLPPPSTFDSKTDHAEQSTAGKLIKPPVTSVIVSRDKHLLGSVKEEGWEGGRLNWWGRSETVQCLFSVYIQKTIECRHWSLSCKLIGGVENSIRETNVEIQSTKTKCTSWSRLPSMCC